MSASGPSQVPSEMAINYLPRTEDPQKLCAKTLTASIVVAGFTLLIYDYFLTLEYEVELIWSQLNRVASLVFIFLRYTTIGLLSTECFDKFYPRVHSSQFCKVWVILRVYISIFCFVAAHVVVAIRVNAFHSNKPRIRWLLVVCGLTYITSTIAFCTVVYATNLETFEPSISKTGGCVSAIPGYLWVGWIPPVFFETVLFALTCWHVKSQWRKLVCGGFQGAYRTLYRDGVVFYIVIVFCSLGSLLVWALLDGSPWAGVIPAFPSAVLEVVATRFIINLRLFAIGANRNVDGTFQGQKSESMHLVTSPSFHFRVYRDGTNAGTTRTTSQWREQDDPPSCDIPDKYECHPLHRLDA